MEALGSALGSLGRFLLSIIRVLFGMGVLILGIVLIVAALIVWAAYQGVIDSGYGPGSIDIPIDLITELVPTWLVVAGFGLMALPGLVLLMLGLSVVVKKALVGSKFGLTILGLWLFCVGLAAFHLPKIISKFKEDEWHYSTTPLSLSPGILLLRVNNLEDEELYKDAVLELVGTKDTVITLTQEYFSRGESKKEALAYAQKILYTYDVRDSVLTFEEGFDMRNLGVYRDQKLNLTLAIPYDKPFIMDRSLLDILQNTIYKNGFENDDVRTEAVWVFNEAGLTCLTCPEIKGERRDWDSFESEKAQLDSITKVQKDSLSKAKLKDAYFLKEN
jgi:hypothetical protein